MKDLQLFETTSITCTFSASSHIQQLLFQVNGGNLQLFYSSSSNTRGTNKGYINLSRHGATLKKKKNQKIWKNLK